MENKSNKVIDGLGGEYLVEWQGCQIRNVSVVSLVN